VLRKLKRERRAILRGERKKIQVESPKGNKVASINLGINNLVSVVLNDETWFLYYVYI
jgi:putative transposase